LCVTHLPQIAAKAGRHYGVTKSTRGQRTRVAVTLLESGDRVDELARMIGGRDVTDALRTSAHELLSRAATGAKVKDKAKGESESPRAAR
jgi:DNA repair protein RecN (Recombination protein N)